MSDPLLVTTAAVGGIDHPVVDIFLIHHDPFGPPGYEGQIFPNLPHVLRAIDEIPSSYRVRIHYCCPGFDFVPPTSAESVNIEWMSFDAIDYTAADWRGLRLGEKLSLLTQQPSGDYAVFLTQFDFPQYDYFSKALGWFGEHVAEGVAAIHVAGFYVNNFAAPAPPGPAGILRNNASMGLYRWGQDSIAEHQLGQICLNKAAVDSLDFERLAGFDVLLAVSVLLEAMAKNVLVYRSRHLLLRVTYGYFHRYHIAHGEAEKKGFWALQYDLMSNYTHEINALYDVFHECKAAVVIADSISGHDLPRAAGVDPAVHTVNHFIGVARPYYRAARKIFRALTFSRSRKPV